MIYSISKWNNIPHWILLWHTTIVYTNIYGRISKALHGTKVARYKRVHPLWFRLYKFLEKCNSLIVRENKEEWGSFWCDENFLNLDGDSGYWSEHILPYFSDKVRKFVHTNFRTGWLTFCGTKVHTCILGDW